MHKFYKGCLHNLLYGYLKNKVHVNLLFRNDTRTGENLMLTKKNI